MQFEFEPIGELRICSDEHSETLMRTAFAHIKFYPPYNREEAFVGLDGFSHIWVVFQAPKSLDSTVSIDRFLVELMRIDRDKGKVSLYVKGAGLIANTSILDIKPYLPYADCIPGATSSHE